ncbi:MAG: GtrA family protein, partial [Candidatus Woesearchaeota archaeon]
MKQSDVVAILIIGEIVGWFLLPILKNIGLEAGVLKYTLPIGMPLAALAGLYIFYLFSKLWRPVFFEIGKFASVGILNTLIDFGILNLLSYLFTVHSGSAIALFNALSFSAAVVNSYFWNKFWTFRAASSDEGVKDFAQ